MDLSDSASKATKTAAAAVRKRDVLPYILLFILLAGLLAVLAGALLPPYYHAVPALLWSLGFCVSGMLLGFLFEPGGSVGLADENHRRRGFDRAQKPARQRAQHGRLHRAQPGH